VSIAERIAEEHQWVTQPDGQQKECTCGALIAMHPADDPLPFHVAELTERAVREHITAELDEWAREHEVMDMPGPYGSGARYALAAAKEITKGDAR